MIGRTLLLLQQNPEQKRTDLNWMLGCSLPDKAHVLQKCESCAAPAKPRETSIQNRNWLYISSAQSHLLLGQECSPAGLCPPERSHDERQRRVEEDPLDGRHALHRPLSRQAVGQGRTRGKTGLCSLGLMSKLLHGDCDVAIPRRLTSAS
jgi:hypothetical protein